MSKRGRSPRLDLGLNLSPAESWSGEVESSWTSTTTELLVSPQKSSSEEGSSSSCVSPDQETTKAMLLVGCPRCLMYVMLSEVDPKCPKCKSTVLLDFLNDDTNNNINNVSTTKKTNN